MKATILIDNEPSEGLVAEWGLAAYIEYEGHRILLDTGATGVFAENAKKLGVDLSSVECGVMSHGHYDHADGLAGFFNNNKTAQMYFREGADGKYYDRKNLFPRYIGVNRRLLVKYSPRITYVSGDYELFPGVTLIPHKTEGLEKMGLLANMYLKKGLHYTPDDFCHEQSLVFDTDKGLVIFNSCSHGGPDNIIREVMETYPDKTVYALVGGLHLFRRTEEEVRALAARVREVGIQKIYTGHCTGANAIEILKEELPGVVETIYTGMRLEF